MVATAMKRAFVLGALGALAGNALAQSNVTLFGIVDLGVEQTRLSPGATALRLTSGIQSGSRWGVKGSEDLGGGLSATFRLESGIDASTGLFVQGGRAFGRQAWVGLDGGFGSFKLGRQYVPLFIATDTVDPFDAGITGDSSGISAVFRHYGVRMDNSATYSTPVVGGFSGTLAYAFGEVPGSTSTGSQYGLSATYDKAPFTAVLAYHRQNTATGATPTGRGSTFMLGGVYDFSIVKLHAAYADNRDANAAGTVNGRSRDYMIGATVPVGTASLLASYTRHKDRFVAHADASYWALGATYPLSRRTNLYASYSKIGNEAAGSTGSGVAGTDISWLNAGIRHVF